MPLLLLKSKARFAVTLRLFLISDSINTTFGELIVAKAELPPVS
jgi:hypothetical protein